jgi:hypothetical protein
VITVLNNTEMRLDLTAAFVYSWLGANYTGAPVLLLIDAQPAESSNALNISFTPLGAPNIEAVVVLDGRCAGSGPSVGCTAMSHLELQGTDLYAVDEILVAAAPCESLDALSSSLLRCRLPIEPGAGHYSVAVSNAAGTTMLYTTISYAISSSSPSPSSSFGSSSTPDADGSSSSSSGVAATDNSFSAADKAGLALVFVVIVVTVFGFVTCFYVSKMRRRVTLRERPRV